MEYTEWKDLKRIVDEKNKFIPCFEYENKDRFYIEPSFYLQLQGVKLHYEERYDDVISEINKIVKENHLVVFEADEENEITFVDNAIYLTIQDVLNRLRIFIEDKSRGSDYGD